jgi:hypothetical protein
MRKVLGCVLVAFALFAGTAGFIAVSSQHAFACDGDHRGS